MNKQPGDIIQSDQLSSFDLKEPVARKFADNAGGQIKVMLHLVNNTKAMDIHEYSTSWLEHEYLAPKNVKYRITKVYRKGDYLYYDIEEV